MKEWEDYFQILQVHILAEPEIIKSAYLRLCKKYHPDVNKALYAGEKMQEINKAYEVLSNPITRKDFLMRWIEKYSVLESVAQEPSVDLHMSFEPCKKVLMTYLGFISKGDVKAAYNLLCQKDKDQITQKDFLVWQSLVAEVFELISFECQVENVYTKMMINDIYFEVIVNFRVQVSEKNHLMGRIEEDAFSRSMVYENDHWRIYLGHNQLSSVIAKYDELASLKKHKHTHGKLNLKETTIDSVSGLFNRKGFKEAADREQIRYSRYGNPFSLIFLEMKFDQYKEDRINQTIKQMGSLLSNCLRKLDFSCRWESNSFMILLPETDQASAHLVVEKIHCIMAGKFKDIEILMVVKEQEYSTFRQLLMQIKEQVLLK